MKMASKHRRARK